MQCLKKKQEKAGGPDPMHSQLDAEKERYRCQRQKNSAIAQCQHLGWTLVSDYFDGKTCDI